MPKRVPVIIDHLRALHCCLDHTNTFDIVVFVVACVAFWCCCRLGELLIDSQFDSKAHSLQSTNIRCDIAANGQKFINFDIPHTKMKLDGNTINISDSTCECSSIGALEHHLNSNTDIPSDVPLFAVNKSWSPMKHMWFIKRCNEVW